MTNSTSRSALFECAIEPHLSALYKTAYRLTGSRADAEDLLQELLVKLYRRFDQWRAMEEPGPWLWRVLYNLHIDLYRKQSRTHGFNPQTLDPELRPTDTLEHPSPSPERGAEADQRQRRLWAALAELDAPQRALVTLHLLEGRTLEETAGILDTPVGTLKSRLHRCKAQLKKSLHLEPFAQN